LQNERLLKRLYKAAQKDLDGNGNGDTGEDDEDDG